MFYTLNSFIFEWNWFTRYILCVPDSPWFQVELLSIGFSVPSSSYTFSSLIILASQPNTFHFQWKNSSMTYCIVELLPRFQVELGTVGFPMLSDFGIPSCLVILDCKVINLLSTMNFSTFSSVHLKTVDLASIHIFSILVLLLFTFFEISVFRCTIVAFWGIPPTEWLGLSITFLIFQVKVSIIIFLCL